MDQVYINLINAFKNLDSLDKEEEIRKQLEEIMTVLNSINSSEHQNINNEELFLDDAYIKILSIKEKIMEFVKKVYDL